MSTVRYEGGQPKVDPKYQTPRVGGPPVEQTWTTIAADVDGVVQEEEIGRHRVTLSAAFAYRDEALDWLAHVLNDPDIDWVRVHGPTPLATLYYGETDSPSNAWSAEVQWGADPSSASSEMLR